LIVLGLCVALVAAGAAGLYFRQTKPTITVATGTPSPSNLRIVNYFPSNAGWGQLWSRYSHDAVDKDFAAIRSLGANTVRLIIQPYDVGYPNVLPAGASGVSDAITTAKKNGLYVQLTLFDGWGTYADLAGSKRWIHSLLADHKDDDRIALVELQNELNMSNHEAMTWARSMLPELKTSLPKVPRTISVRGSDQAVITVKMIANFPSSLIDVINVHLYGAMTSIANDIAVVKQRAGNRPVIFGESGIPTDTPSTVGSEEKQAQFFRSVWALCLKNGFPPPAPWTLNDLTPTAVVGHTPADASYGLRRLDGTWKAVAEVIRQMFAAATPANDANYAELPGLKRGQKPSTGSLDILNIDGSFSKTDTSPAADGSVGSWKIFQGKQAVAAGVKPAAGFEGGRAAFLSQTTGNNSGVPGVVLILPILNSNSISVKAKARLDGKASGTTQISIAWFGAAGNYLGQSLSKAADNKVTDWQTLGVDGKPPAGALVFQIHLKSANNAGTVYFDDVTLRQP